MHRFTEAIIQPSSTTTSRSYATDNSNNNSTLDWEYWVNKVGSGSTTSTTTSTTSSTSSTSTSERKTHEPYMSEDSILFNNLLQTISSTNKSSSGSSSTDFSSTSSSSSQQSSFLSSTSDLSSSSSTDRQKGEKDEEEEERVHQLSLRESLPLIRAMLKNDTDALDGEVIKRLMYTNAPLGKIGEQIVRQVNEQYEKLSAQDFDKLFYEAQAENLVLNNLKHKSQNVKKIDGDDDDESSNRKLAEMLLKLEPETLSLAPNDQFKELIDSLLDGTLSVNNLSEMVREAKSKHARKSMSQRKQEQLVTSYKYYLKQRDLDLEMQRKDKAFGELVRKFHAIKQQSPELYQQQLKELKSKILPPGAIDGVLNRLVAGDSIPEVKRYFDSLTHEELQKPEYEIDVHEKYREEVQAKIDRIQEGLLYSHGRKTGRRGATPIRFTLTSDEHLLRELSKSSENSSFAFPYVDMRTAMRVLPTMLSNEKIEPKMISTYKYGKTYLAPRAADKRQKRTEKRRMNIVRLENTVRAFMWIRKHKPKFFA